MFFCLTSCCLTCCQVTLKYFESESKCGVLSHFIILGTNRALMVLILLSQHRQDAGGHFDVQIFKQVLLSACLMDC